MGNCANTTPTVDKKIKIEFKHQNPKPLANYSHNQNYSKYLVPKIPDSKNQTQTQTTWTANEINKITNKFNLKENTHHQKVKELVKPKTVEKEEKFIQLIHNSLQNKKHKEAKSLCKRFLQKQSQKQQQVAYVHYLLLQLDQGNFENHFLKAQQIYKKTPKKYSFQILSLQARQAHIYQQNKSYQKSIKIYKQILSTTILPEHDQKILAIMNNLACVYYINNQIEQAIKLFDNCVELAKLNKNNQYVQIYQQNIREELENIDLGQIDEVEVRILLYQLFKKYDIQNKTY